MKQFYKKIFQNFAQLRLAIFLLLIIAAISILGTIIEQNQSTNYYLSAYSKQIGINELTIGKIILIFGLNNVFNSIWFISILLLFAFCLVSCTIIQQLPIVKKAKLILFNNRSNRTNNNNELDLKLKKKIKRQLKKNQYISFQQNKILYAYKGLIGRFAPIIVHASMIIILFGTLIASLTGFKYQEIIPKGEIIQTQNIIAQNFLTHLKPNTLRVNDFWITYNKQQSIQQFYSDISILNQQGEENLRKTIKVNFPLHYQNLTIYQTDWNLTGIRIHENGQITQLLTQPLNQTKTTWITLVPKHNLIILNNNLEGKFNVFSENGKNLGNYELNEYIANFNFKIINFISETGLEIKSDPGIPIIYFGFGSLIISGLLSYLSYNQYWLTKNKRKLNLEATTNRAKLNLQTQLKSLQNE